MNLVREDKNCSVFFSSFHLILVYNKGLISIVQRLLTFMSEEDAFWSLVGLAKAFNNVFVFDFK